ncbi:MAG: glycosyltransferase family 2 protein [Saprospiraceae bacterium]|nr:glycosyltransferase family 2 protein [Saprospiraceae bacterium]
MKIAGFTFVRNALKFDYPVVEAIRSVLPLCDYFVVAVGNSEDETLALIQSIGDPKIHIFQTVWDDSLRAGGRVLALETDKAFQAIPADFDWCFYIQGDECIHEQDIPAIRSAMEQYLHDPNTEGLLFHYRHFYGSYDYLGVSRRWYRREVRVVRNDKRIFSYKDAQGFRINDKGQLRKLKVRLVPAHIHHYGWVRHPQAQQQKQWGFHRLYMSDEGVRRHVGDEPHFIYDGSEPLVRFEGIHPAVMQPRVQAQNWKFESDPARMRWSFKERLSAFIEKWTGWRVGEYRNYTRV